jgi:hypothetical protein
MSEEPDTQDSDQRQRPSAGGYWSTPADDIAEAAAETAVIGVAAAAGNEDATEGESHRVSVTTPALGAPDALVTGAQSAELPRAPTAALGWVALSLAAACIIADVMAVVLATQRYWVSATAIAQGASVATAVVFVVGLFAAFRRPARWLGIGAMILAILANPFILTNLLTFLGGS